MEDTFQSKYEEFCLDLETSIPELKNDISVAKAIPDDQRMDSYKRDVFKLRMKSDTHIVLPGVIIPKIIWTSLSKATIISLVASRIT